MSCIRSIRLLIPMLAALSMGIASPGTAENPEPAPVPADGGVSEISAVPAPPTDHPLAAEIQNLREAMRLRLEHLELRRAGALDAEAELQLQGEISLAKLDFELGMLELQLGHQAAMGRKTAVEELTAAIDVVMKMREELRGTNEILVPHEDPAGDGAR